MTGLVAGRFARYQVTDHLAGTVPACAAWLTGQSSYRHSQLSPGQLELLDAVAAEGFAAVRAGFPFNAEALSEPYHREPMAAASARNAAQYLAARLDRRFQAELTRHLQPLFDRTGRRLVLLCGSCGLELLTAALPRLAMPAGLRVLAVALGPVGRCLQVADDARIRLHVIQGTGDWISRLGYRRTPDLRVRAGHMGYLHRPVVRAEVVRVCAEFLR
jgi:hypothetical protein